MPENPISLNLALIVHRLMTNPEGWAVDELMEDLNIRDRTYRKYRKILQEQFAPFKGTSNGVRVQEVEVQGIKRLRLVSNGHGAHEADRIPGKFAALHLARIVAHLVDEEGPIETIRSMYEELFGELDPANGQLRDILMRADRLFYHLPLGGRKYEETEWILRGLVKALVLTRAVELTFGDGTLRVHPLTLVLIDDQLVLVYRDDTTGSIENRAVDEIGHISPLGDAFEYPADYHPADWT